MRLRQPTKQPDFQTSMFEQKFLQVPQMYFVTTKKQGDDPQTTTYGNYIHRKKA